MSFLQDRIQFAKDNYDKVKHLYLHGSRQDIADFLGMKYNSVGHVLSALNLNSRYNKDIIVEKKEVYFNTPKCKNPFIEENEMSSYCLGFILGDGSLHPKKNVESYVVNIFNNDRSIMEKINSLFYDNRPLSVRHYDREIDLPDGYSVDINDKYVYNSLYDYGIRPNKSKVGCILPVVSEGNLRHLVRGLFDSDGSISLNRNQLRFWLFGHPSYMSQLKDILPFPTYYSIRKDNLAEIAVYRKKVLVDLYHYLYDDATIYIERKKEVFENVFS